MTKRNDQRDPSPSRTDTRVVATSGGKTAQERKFDVDVHHLLREHGPGAIATLAAMLNDPAARHMAKIIAANSLLDRGWGGRRRRFRSTTATSSWKSARKARMSFSLAAPLSLESALEQRTILANLAEAQRAANRT